MRNYVRRPTDYEYGSDSYPHQSDSLPHSQDALCVGRNKSDLDSNKRIVKKGPSNRIYIPNNVTMTMLYVTECAAILKQICEVLIFMHNRGYLHNDLKRNNVVLDGTSHKATLIDFGKSKKITKMKLTKAKANIAEAALKYPHITPEIHRGERQSTASDVYSFGVLTLKVLKDGKFDNPALKSTAKRCLSSIPVKRPKLEEIF